MFPARPLSQALAAIALLAGTAGLRAEISSWTNADGTAVRAEFLGRKGDYVSFRKEDGAKYLYPYAKLTPADRARVDALSRPASELAAASEQASGSSAAPASGRKAIAPLGTILAAVSEKIVTLQNGGFVTAPATRLAGVRYLAIYYSAHWCPPCRGFTPELVEAYKTLKEKHPEFEVIFVSSDHDENAMKDYMSEYRMAWPALRFGEKKNLAALRRPKNENGIPNLVFMDSDGKDLSLSFNADGSYRGPRAVLADIRKHFKD